MAWDDDFILWDRDGYDLVNAKPPGMRLAVLISP